MRAKENRKTGTIAGFLTLAHLRIDRLDARLLMQGICGMPHTQIIAEPQTPIAASDWQILLRLLERRAHGEPLAYLLGETEFRGRRFKVTPDVLIPRPETEELVDLARQKLVEMTPQPPSPSPPLRCVDLGTGSGIIAVSLKLEHPAAQLHAVDLSLAALAVARQNAQRLGADICFHLGNWLSPLAGQYFDLIVANPPYIAGNDPHLQGDGLPHEPQMALTDGGDGLQCIRTIISAAPRHLKPGGWLLFEHGHDQGEAARALLATSGLSSVFTLPDLAGSERISGGKLAPR